MISTHQMPAPDQVSEPPRTGRSPYLPYVCAVLTIALALLARMLLTPYIGAQFPFATFFIAVTLIAWYGGLRPALLAAVLGYLAAVYFIIPPYHTLALQGLTDYIGAGIYLFVSLTSALFSEAQHKARARAEANFRASRTQEATARESEARKGAILETALDAILTMDHEGRILEFNPAAETMFGLQRTDAVGKEMAELILPPSLRELHRRGLARYLATGEGSVLGKRIEITALRADGTEFPVELAVTRIPVDGPPLFSGHIHDITLRKRSETQQRFLTEASDLLASSLDYQTTLRSVAQLVVPHLADWCVVHLLNAEGTLELVTAMHVDPARVEAARESSRRYPPRMDAPRGLGAVVRSGKSERIEHISEDMIRAAAQDEEHYRLLSTSGLKSFLCVPLVARGKILGALTFVGAESGHVYTAESLPLAEELARRAALAVDNARLYAEAQREIEERQQAEQALQESRDYYRALTEAMPQLVWMTQADGVPTYFNPQWLDYTGQNPTAGGIWWKGGIHPDDLALTMERWTTAVRTGAPYEVEYRLKRADGVYRWFLARGVPLKNAQGVILNWFGTCTDIDDQKRAEIEIADLNARLRRSVQETHHRVKNNLQIISALAELQAEDGQDTVPVTAVKRIGQHTRSLAAIHDLLTRETKGDVHADSISTRAALEKLIPLLQATAGGQCIRAEVDDFRLPVREGASLALLVSELVSNAVKHGQGDIELRLSLKEDIARLEVCDDGPGFPPDFDWRVAANTGLGLIDSIGRHDLRGTLSFDNRPQGGAEVSVTFPLPMLTPGSTSGRSHS